MSKRIGDLEFEPRADVLVARLSGEVDSSNTSELLLAISSRLPATASGLVLDLAQVAYLDSAGIELLFELGRRLRTRRQSLRLVVPRTSPVRRVLELCDIAIIAPLDELLDHSVTELRNAAE
jgi:anti-anti-sigma factor